MTPIAILKEHEAGIKSADLCRKHGSSEGNVLQLEGQVTAGRDLTCSENLQCRSVPLQNDPTSHPIASGIAAG